MRTSDKRDILRDRSRSGSTLVEALVSVILLAMGIAGSCRVMLMSRMLSDASTDQYISLQLANNRLECINNTDFGDVMMWANSNMVLNASGQPAPSGRFRMSTDVSFPDQVITNYAQVSVSIAIRNRKTLLFDRPARQFATYVTEL